MRCFIAVDIDEAVRRQVARLQSELAKRLNSVRWTRPEQMHLTLKFLGEVADADVPAACEAAAVVAAERAPFELTVRSVGCFPERGSPRVLWVGLADPSGQLQACRDGLEEAMEMLGFERERKQFHPHLTLGRTRDGREAARIHKLLDEKAGFDAGACDIEELVVYQSILDRGGPTYTALSRAALAGRP